MSAFPASLASMPQSERNRFHLGIVTAVELFDGGTNPGPASKMRYTIECNDLPGPLTEMRPSEWRWDDSWDVHALAVGQPVVLALSRGVVHLVTHEERAEEECP